MFLLKRTIKIIIILSTFFLFVPVIKEIRLVKKTNEVIKEKSKQSPYEGFIYIPKFEYRSLIKKDSSALDENLVELTDFSDDIGESNIILAGHNSKYVFNKIYYLNNGNEIIISDFNTDYLYIVDNSEYIKVDDFSKFNSTNSLTLITCTNNNQERYIVIARRN